MNWDDLRVVRAVYQAGSYAAAARKLGVNPTTVPRRLERLEKDLGVRLFEAVDGGRRATARCEEVVALTERIAQQLDGLPEIAGAGGGVTERRRIAATDSVSACLLAPRLPDFLGAHPAIGIDLLASTENVDFFRWEADLAVRLKRPDKGDFILTRLADFELFLCEPADHDADQPIVCMYPEALDGTPESTFLRQHDLQRHARCRSKNLLVLRELVAAGRCAAILPDFMCTDLETKTPIRLTPLPESRTAWLLIQRHLRDDPATRLVVDWVRSCVTR